MFSLSDRAMLANLSIKTWAGERVDRDTQKEVAVNKEAQNDAVNVRKRLVPAEYLRPISSLNSELRAAHYRMTMAWSDYGPRLLPSKAFLKYTETVEPLIAEGKRLVDDFARQYPTILAGAHLRMGKLYDASEFPGSHEIRDRFAYDLNFLPVPDAGDFRVDLDSHLRAEIQRDIEQRAQHQFESTRRELWERAYTVVSHMADRLKSYQPGSNGIRASGVFRDSMVRNVEDMADLLPLLNVGDDPELDKLAKDLKRKLCAFDAETLRNHDGVRAKVAADADRIVAAMAGYLEAA